MKSLGMVTTSTQSTPTPVVIILLRALLGLVCWGFIAAIGLLISQQYPVEFRVFRIPPISISDWTHLTVIAILTIGMSPILPVLFARSMRNGAKATVVYIFIFAFLSLAGWLGVLVLYLISLMSSLLMGWIHFPPSTSLFGIPTSLLIDRWMYITAGLQILGALIAAISVNVSLIRHTDAQFKEDEQEIQEMFEDLASPLR